MSNKVIDYEIVHDRTLTGLEFKVKAKLKSSWIPQGGVYVIVNNLKGTHPEEYCQAMIKLEE